MKSYFGNYLGIVIDNNDPEYRGRVQIFIPHLMPTLYENWNQKGENISLKCVGDNVPEGLSSEIVDKLRKILPWAEAASPIIGQSAPGGASITAAIAGAITNVGNAIAQTITNTTANATANAAANATNSTEQKTTNFDQTPSALPAGSLPPGTSCLIPAKDSADTKNLLPGFIARLNAFYNEASALGYKFLCSDGFRSFAQQDALYKKYGPRQASKPGGSTHELGIAVDLKVEGPGVSIQRCSTAVDRTENKDTPAYRALLAKHGLHQPLHPEETKTTMPEKWHIEPIETPKAFAGDRSPANFKRIASAFGSSQVPPVAESTSGSQFPPASSPLSTKDPSKTDLAESFSPTTNTIPVKPAENASALNFPATPITGGSKTAASATTPSPSQPSSETQPQSQSSAPASSSSASGVQQLAKDRIAYFEKELSDPQVLNRIEFVTKKEGGVSGRLIFETACNRAMFSNTTLKATLYQRAYFKDSKKDPNADKTTPHTQFTLDQIQRVIYNGGNDTNLATDQAYNDKILFAKKFIDLGVTGDWFDLNNGQKITDPQKIIQLTNNPGSGMQEFIYRKDGRPYDGSSQAGKRAKQYADKYNIQPTTPSNFNSNTPLPDNLKDASKSSLTNEPLNTSSSPATVNTTDSHGPTVVKNTNDCAKGMFAFPGVGAMVWVFFREGNPLFPVYFAASYSSSEWKSAYNGYSLNPAGTNNGNVGNQISSSTKFNPNAGGGLEFTHIKDTSDPSGVNDKAVAMMYGDDGSNMMFSRGYHQIYTRHDRRDQIDGHLYNIIGGTEEKWIEDDSSVNVRGNVIIKIGKIDKDSLDVMKELSDFSKQVNDSLMSTSQNS